MIIAYYANINDYSWDSIRGNLRILPEREQKKILDKRKDEDRCLILLGKMILLHILNKYENWNRNELPEISYNEYGKPYIKNIKGHFNISHSGNIVICGYSEKIIGLDIEKIQPFCLEDFKYILTKGEYCLLKQGNINDFYKIWTQKEAVSKAMGRGFYLDLVSIDTHKNIKKRKSVMYYEGQKWEIYTSENIFGYVLTIVSENINDLFIETLKFC